MAFLGDLVIRLAAQTADFQQDLGKAAYMAEKAAKQMQRAFEALGATVSAAKFVEFVDSTIEAMDHLQDLSQTTGIAVEKLSEMQQIGRLSGTSLDLIAQSAEKLARNMSSSGSETQTAAGAFKFLGLSVRDSAGNFKDLGVMQREIAVALNKYSDGAGKVALLQDLMGKSAGTLIPYMHDLAEAGARNANVTAEQAQAAQDLLVAIREMQNRSETTKIELISGLIPALDNLLTVFKDLSGERGNVEQLGTMIGNGLRGVALVAGSAYLAIRDMGDGIGALAAQGRALLSLDLGAVAAIGKARDQQYADNMAKFEAFQSRVKDTLPGIAKSTVVETKPSANYNRNDPGEKLAEMKLYTSALQRLEMELANLDNWTQEQRTRYEETAGSLQKLTAVHKEHLLQVAREIDLRKVNIERIQSEGLVLLEEERIRAASAEAFKSFHQQDVTRIADLQFQTSLVGQNAIQTERLTATYQIHTQALARQREMAAQYGEDTGGLMDALMQLDEQEKKLTRDSLEAIAQRVAAERNWQTGVANAINQYVDDVTNAAKQTETLFTNAFKNMEDALVNFAKTGKLDFKSLADSIISDIIRINVQRNIMAPLVGTSTSPGIITSGLTSLAKSLFGFATGGDFTVGGGGGTDSQMVAFRATPGEMVSVRTPGQSGEGGSMVFNVDMRGASVDAVQRLEAYVGQLGAQLNAMPAAIADMKQRGGAFRSRLS